MSLKQLNQFNQDYIKNSLNRESSWFEYQIGDIFERPDIDILIHQANCFNIMSAGIAHYIHTYYPEAFIEDQKTQVGDKNKLGTFSIALVKNKNFDKELMIVNLYSQYRPGKCTNIENDFDSEINRLTFMLDGLKKLAEFIQLFFFNIPADKKIRIGIPWLIGCGIAGADYNKVFSLIRSIFESLRDKVTIVFIDLNGD